MMSLWSELANEIGTKSYMREYCGGDKRLAVFTPREYMLALHKITAAVNCVLRDHKEWREAQ